MGAGLPMINNRFLDASVYTFGLLVIVYYITLIIRSSITSSTNIEIPFCTWTFFANTYKIFYAFLMIKVIGKLKYQPDLVRKSDTKLSIELDEQLILI